MVATTKPTAMAAATTAAMMPALRPFGGPAGEDVGELTSSRVLGSAVSVDPRSSVSSPDTLLAGWKVLVVGWK